MSKRNKFLAVVVLFLAILYVSTEGEPLDWTPGYYETGTKPMDTKIFFDQLSGLFKDRKIRKVYHTFYEYAKNGNLDTLESNQNYISISNKFKMDEVSFNTLLDFIAKGNHAFISARSFPDFVKDTLGFKMGFDPVPIGLPENELGFYFSDAKLRYKNKLKQNITYIKDSVTFLKLGYMIDRKKEKQINFVIVPFGKGVFYIHTQPEIFTNYQLLDAEDTGYLETLISYLPESTVYFNHNMKQDPNLSTSPLRYILTQPALKWAWYLCVIGMGLFMYFNGKRRQRIIPELPEKINTTTDFVKTMSNLYHESQAYNNIIHKEITYFLEYIRNKYHLSTEKLDENFNKKLALKSAKDVNKIRTLIEMINRMRGQQFNSKSPLIDLHKKIEAFYKK